MRFSRLFGGSEREVTISRGQAPVEENREAGLVLDVSVPVLQARYAAAALAAVVASAVFLIAAMGENVLYAGWFVLGVTTFIWWMWKALHFTLDEPGEDGHKVAVTLFDLLVGIIVTLFPGFLAWCLWRVIAMLVPSFALPAWMSHETARIMRDVWRTVAPLTSLLSFVFSCSFWLHIELAFIQELAQRSPHQEKSVWDAIGQLIVHHGKKYQPKERTILVRQSGGAKALPKQQKEQASITAKAAAASDEADASDGEQLQFLSNLEAWIVDGGRIGTYSRSAWTGRILTNGTIVTDGLWREMKDTLVEAGWMTSDNAGTRLNYSLPEVLVNISAPPQAVGRRSARREYPTHPTPTPPTQED
jgi:hypothetical protein